MIKINRYLAHKNRDITNIVFSVHFKGNRIKFTSKISIPTNDWDSRKQRIKPTYRLHSSYNKRLQKIEDFILNTYVELYDKNPNIDDYEFKNIVKSFISGKHKVNLDIFQLYDLYIENAKKQNHLKKSTEGLYINIRNTLKKYSQDSNQKLLLSDFNSELINDFKEFCYDALGNTDNTVNVKLTILCSWLNYAFKKKYIQQQDYKNALKVKTHKVESVVLTDDEVKLIENYSGIEFENTKFWFLLQLYTGVRISDISRINNNNIDLDNGIINLTTLKTNKQLYIPISNKLNELLLTHSFEDYELENRWQYLDKIRELCKTVGIDKLTNKVSFVKNEQVITEVEKYKLIGSHTARRTFITRLISNGVAPSEIMKITGHTTRDAFDKYIRISEIEAVSKVKSALNGM